MSHRILDYKVEFNGELKSILEFSNESGIDSNIIYQRIKREKISNKTTKNLLDPVRSVKRSYTVGQESLNLRSWANKLNVDYDLLRVFIYGKKIPLEKIVSGEIKVERRTPTLFLDGKPTTVFALSKITNISRFTISKLLEKYTPDEIVKNGNDIIKKEGIGKQLFTYKN